MSVEPQSLRFAYEWEPADGVRAPELAATWCRLEIWVGADCVSWVEDRTSGSTRRSIYCSLYPLAEWIAFNWWFLQAHVRPSALGPAHWSFSRLRANGAREHGWLRHHNLRAAGDGFRWPNLTVVPEGEQVRVVWLRDAAAADGAPVRFINSGEHLADTAETLSTLADVVESVLARLREAELDTSPLEEEWSVNGAMSTGEREFCVAAARLGVDPFAAPEDISAALLRVSERLDDMLMGEFLDAVDPEAVLPGLDWIAKGNELIARSAGVTDDRLNAIRVAVPSTTRDASQPWTIGYEQAVAARSALDLKPTDLAEPENLMRVLSFNGTDRGLQALGGTSSTEAPALLVTQGGSQRRRFAAARALWHFGGPDPRPRFLLTPARTDPHKAERAFAAEFLAPASGLREILLGTGDDDLDAAAAHFNVSPLLVRHQVDNQLLAV